MNNLEVRQAIAKKRLKYYEVAAALNISTHYFSHLLQRELDPERKAKILEVIENYEF